jgi:hypothetical protein
MEPQVFGLFRRELEHEIRGEADRIALDRLVEHLGPDFIESGEVAVEHDLLTTNQQNQVLDR